MVKKCEHCKRDFYCVNTGVVKLTEKWTCPDCITVEKLTDEEWELLREDLRSGNNPFLENKLTT